MKSNVILSFFLIIFSVFLTETSSAQSFEEYGFPSLTKAAQKENTDESVVKTEENVPNNETKQKQATAEPNKETKPQETTEKPEATEEKEEEIEPKEITITLPPENSPIPVPYFEHIPYFFSDIQILPDGSVKINETIKFIVKGNIIKSGISRLFPKKTYNRMNQLIKGDVDIIAVYRDGIEEPFTVKQTKLGVLITTGDKDLPLESGEHTYEISYVAHRQVSMFDNFDEFFWNITGANWNLIITRVGARITLPLGAKPLLRKGFVVLKDRETNDFISFKDRTGNILFGTTRPLGLGEGFVTLVSWEKGYITPPTTEKKIFYFLRDNGNLVAGLCGFITILMSYLLSWFFFKQKSLDKNIKTSSSVPKELSSAIIRFLHKNIFDSKAFVTSLIFLAQKNFIIIEEKEDGSFSIIKRAEKSRLLSRSELLLLNLIFPNKQTSFELSNKNALSVRKAMNDLFNAFQSENKKLLLKNNKPYIIFNLSMFVITYLAMGLLSTDPVYTIMVSTALGILMTITFSMLIYFINSFKKDNFLKAINNISSMVIPSNNSLFKKIILLIGILIFGLGSYIGVLLYIEATSLYAAILFSLMPFTIALFYNIFNSRKVLGTITTNIISGYYKFISNGTNITPPITKEIAAKNKTIFHRHLAFVIALDLETTWCAQFIPKDNIDINDISYRPFWYSGNRSFNLHNVSKDLTSLLSDLNNVCQNISGLH